MVQCDERCVFGHSRRGDDSVCETDVVTFPVITSVKTALDSDTGADGDCLHTLEEGVKHVAFFTFSDACIKLCDTNGRHEENTGQVI